MPTDASPILVALVDDYDVVLTGIASMLDPYRDRVLVAEIDANEPLVDTVDIALYDSFAQPESDHDEIEVLVHSPRANRVVVYTWNFHPDLIEARGGAARTATCPRRCRPANWSRRSRPCTPARRSSANRRRGRAPAAGLDWPGRREGLTDREAEILALITQGKSNAEVAALTFLSPNTIKSYIRTDLSQDRRRQPHPGRAVGRQARVHARPPPHRPLARRPLTARRLRLRSMTAPRDDRPYDVVLLGATGFAGKLTADYLARAAPADARWALAGATPTSWPRCVTRCPGRRTFSLLTSRTRSRCAGLPSRPRVLATTVGPYIHYGDGVVAACAASGTDYLDLTGEPEFIDTSYVRHHRTALDTGARLVHAAGFDSIPHDLGALFTVEQLPTDVPITVSGYVRANAAFSGGTFHSARHRLLAAAADRGRCTPAQVDGDRAERAVALARVGGRPHRDPTQHGWAMPLPTVDPQIVARSAAPSSGTGRTSGTRTTHRCRTCRWRSGLRSGSGCCSVSRRSRPRGEPSCRASHPGDGPSAAKRAKSWFTVTFVGTGGGERVVTRVSGGDPGYDETAKMLAESALCLAFDDLPETSGQVTTAVAMGDALIERLTKAGMGFDVIR